MDKADPEQKRKNEETVEYIEEWLSFVKEFISIPNNLRFLSILIILVVFLPMGLLFILPDKFGVTANQVGDTFGGIAGPIINIFAALIVYISFREQFKANQIQFKYLKDQQIGERSEKNYQFINNEYLDAIKLLNSFQIFEHYIESDPGFIKSLHKNISSLSGAEAINNILWAISIRVDNKIPSKPFNKKNLYDLEVILRSITNFFYDYNTLLLHSEDKLRLKKLFQRFYDHEISVFDLNSFFVRSVSPDDPEDWRSLYNIGKQLSSMKIELDKFYK